MRIATLAVMQHEHMKIAVGGAWVLACSVMALSVGVNSASGWIVLVGLGLLPPLMLFRFWRPPVRTMSESIHEVLK
jgi:hypothetical protein